LEVSNTAHKITKEKLDEIESQRSQLHYELGASEQLQSDTANDLKKCREECDELKVKLQDSEELYSNTTMQLKECQEECDTLKTAVSASEEQKKRLAEIEGKLESKIAGLERKLEQEEGAHDHTTDDLEACEEELGGIKDQLADSKEQLGSAE
jgi:chromosome segregation ATPase